MCARPLSRVRPISAPRASGSHHGAPSPVNAGTQYTPSDDAMLAATVALSAAVLDEPELVAQPLHHACPR